MVVRIAIHDIVEGNHVDAKTRDSDTGEIRVLPGHYHVIARCVYPRVIGIQLAFGRKQPGLAGIQDAVFVVIAQVGQAGDNRHREEVIGAIIGAKVINQADEIQRHVAIVADQIGPDHLCADGQDGPGGIIRIFVGRWIERIDSVDGLFDFQRCLSTKVIIGVAIGICRQSGRGVVGIDRHTVFIRAGGYLVAQDAFGCKQPLFINIEETILVGIADVEAEAIVNLDRTKIIGIVKRGTGIVDDAVDYQCIHTVIGDQVGPYHVVTHCQQHALCVIGVLFQRRIERILGIDGLLDAHGWA